MYYSKITLVVFLSLVAVSLQGELHGFGGYEGCDFKGCGNYGVFVGVIGAFDDGDYYGLRGDDHNDGIFFPGCGEGHIEICNCGKCSPVCVSEGSSEDNYPGGGSSDDHYPGGSSDEGSSGEIGGGDCERHGTSMVLGATSVPTQGGNVTIIGENFVCCKDKTSVFLGPIPCLNTTCVNDSVITCEVSNKAWNGWGALPVAVIDDGVSTNSTSSIIILFTWDAPRIDNVTISKDGKALIEGTSFGNQIPLVDITFGVVECKNVQYLTPHTQVTCVLSSEELQLLSAEQGSEGGVPVVMSIDGLFTTYNVQLRATATTSTSGKPNGAATSSSPISTSTGVGQTGTSGRVDEIPRPSSATSLSIGSSVAFALALASVLLVLM